MLAVFGAVVLLTGVGFLLWHLLQGLGQVPMGGPEDERPPIIVSDGSIEMNAVEDRKFQDRGKWQKDHGVFYHEHQGSDPNAIVAHVLYGMPASPGTTSPCSDPSHAFIQTSLTIEAAGDVTQQVTVAVQTRPSNKKTYVGVTPGNNSDVRGQPFIPSNWLRAGNSSNKLSAVTFNDGPDAGVRCDLTGQRALLVMYQRVQ